MRPAAKVALQDFSNMFSQFFSMSEKLNVSNLIWEIIRLTGYEEFLKSQFSLDELESKKENLTELQNVASEYNGLAPREWLSLFLEEVALISDHSRINVPNSF